MKPNPNGRGLPRTIRQMWSAEHDAYLKQHHPNTPDKAIAAHLGRSTASVRMRADKLKLKKAPDYRQPGQFKVGCNQHPPRPAPEARPYAYFDGQIVAKKHPKDTCSYNYRRLTTGKWKPNNRYEWEQRYGPIPAGHLLRCKTADTLNDDPDNWEMLTQQQHALHNQIGSPLTPGVRLTPGYVVGSLTRGRPDLRPLVAANQDLIQAQYLRLTLNRTISNVLGNKAQ